MIHPYLSIMVYSFQDRDLGGFLALSTDFGNDFLQFRPYKNLIHIHWNRGDNDLELLIDGVRLILKSGQIATTTYLQKLEFRHVKNLTSFAFNREFYCVQTHDHEVSCNGIIFFGAMDIPIVSLDEDEQAKFNNLYQVFLDEYRTRDRNQGEMLRILLKRLIIKTTRLAKEQLITKDLDDGQVDVIRKFNLLVDEHFRNKHKLGDYAELLYRSPKTLSNLFARFSDKSPLQIIHERIVLEGKRLLLYTDKTVKEIAFDLGFDNAGAFNKLFKKIEGISPGAFKKRSGNEGYPK